MSILWNHKQMHGCDVQIPSHWISSNVSFEFASLSLEEQQYVYTEYMLAIWELFLVYDICDCWFIKSTICLWCLSTRWLATNRGRKWKNWFPFSIQIKSNKSHLNCFMKVWILIGSLFPQFHLFAKESMAWLP